MSLINDALKRAAESQGQAQAQAQTRPRGPKGVEDLPVPMTPVAARERPAWLPVVGIGLLVVVLLGGSGFFFAKWWAERKAEQKAWQPYPETPEDDPATNAVANAKPPLDTKQAKANTKLPPVTPPVATNPVVKTNVEVAVVPPTKLVTPEPPPPKATNPVVNVAVISPTKQPDPVVPKTAVEPPPVTPPTKPPVVKVEPNTVVVVPPGTKKGDDHGKTAAVEFPELKLQGIIRGKKKTTAIVNGKMLSLGEHIEGAFLLKIEQESVTFEKGSVRRELFLLR